MKVSFTSDGWDDFCHWIEADRKVLVRIKRLISESSRHPFEGIGKPEPLRGQLAGWWSRRIDKEHRLVYRIEGTGAEAVLTIAQCRYHY